MRSTLMPTARALCALSPMRVDMGAVAGLAIEEMADATMASVQMSSDGTPKRLPAPKTLLKVSLVIGTDWRSVSQRATPARSPMRGERHQEGRQPEIGDEQPVDRADRRRRRASPAAAPRNQKFCAEHHRREQRRDRDDRADREVDLAGGQHEDHADRHDGDRRGLLDDVEEVAGGEEAVVPKDDREADEDEDEADIDDVSARIDRPEAPPASPAIGSRLRVSVAGGVACSDWNQPSLMLSLVIAMASTA